MPRLVGLLLLAVVASLADDGPLTGQEPKAKATPAQILKLADADGDGKLSRDEFKKFFNNLPAVKAKDNPKLADFVFDRFDADKDGSLDKKELAAFLAGAKGKGPLPKDAPEKDAAKLDPTPTQDQLAFFEKKIRPVLVAECYGCHSAEAEKVRGGLLLDTRAGSAGRRLRPGPRPRPAGPQPARQGAHADDVTAMPPRRSCPTT